MFFPSFRCFVPELSTVSALALSLPAKSVNMSSLARHMSMSPSLLFSTETSLNLNSVQGGLAKISRKSPKRHKNILALLLNPC